MKSVMFRFKSTTPVEKQEELLNTIRSWKEVQGTGRMRSAPEDHPLFRTGYVYVPDNTEPAELTEKLKSLDGVEDAFAPAERHL